MQRRKIFSGLTLLIALGCGSLAYAWEPMVLENGHIRVKSSIGGIEGFSIIDTGAEMNAINSIFLHVHKLDFPRGDTKVKVGGVYGEEIRRTYRRVPVTIWDTEIPFRDLVDVNLRNKDMQMLLGAGFIANFIWQFDYPNKRMRVFPRDAIDMKKAANIDGMRDPAGGSPLVKVKLDGKSVWLTLDTGAASGIVLDRAVAVKQKWLEKYETTTSTSYGAVSSGQKVSFNIESLEIGPFELGNPIVSVPPKGERWNMFERRATTGSNVRRSRGKSRGLLGFDVLKHFVVTIDYKTGQVHLGTPEGV